MSGFLRNPWRKLRYDILSKTRNIQYIPRNMHTVFALLCFVVVIRWLIFPYPSGLLHWHCGNLTIAPVPAKQPWWIWINTSCEFIMNDCITTTKQSTTKPCAYFLGYTVYKHRVSNVRSLKSNSRYFRACRRGCGMGCLLWVSASVIYALLLSCCIRCCGMITLKWWDSILLISIC